jgi:hypothetical protein
MSDDEREKAKANFHLKEYEILRREIDSLQKAQRTNEQQAVLATAAVWTWAATHTPATSSPVFGYAWWIPLGVVLLCFVRNFTFLEGMFRLSRRMAEIERELQVRGWETIQGEQRETRVLKQIRGGPYQLAYLSATLFWAGLGIGTVVVPLLVLR